MYDEQILKEDNLKPSVRDHDALKDDHMHEVAVIATLVFRGLEVKIFLF